MRLLSLSAPTAPATPCRTKCAPTAVTTTARQLSARTRRKPKSSTQRMMAARAMKGSLDILKPLMKGDASTTLGKVVIGTVKGDLHDIGKNLVASMLEGCGFEVINLGVDVPSDKFIAAIKENNADILCLSALLTTTMNYMKDVIEALKADGLRDQVKVMVGGAPVTAMFAEQVGADGYSEDASEAVALARRLVSA